MRGPAPRIHAARPMTGLPTSGQRIRVPSPACHPFRIDDTVTSTGVVVKGGHTEFG